MCCSCTLGGNGLLVVTYLHLQHFTEHCNMWNVWNVKHYANRSCVQKKSSQEGSQVEKEEDKHHHTLSCGFLLIDTRAGQYRAQYRPLYQAVWRKKISKRMENIRWCHHASWCIMMHHDASCIFVGTGFWIDIFRNNRKHWNSFEFIWTHWSFSKSNSNEAIEALGSLGHPENQIVGEIFESKRHVKKM